MWWDPIDLSLGRRLLFSDAWDLRDLSKRASPEGAAVGEGPRDTKL